MDLTKRDVREITMPKHFNKKTVPYWTIAVLVILIAIILAVHFKANSSSQTTTTTVKTSSSSEKASSSTKKYVAGKDYKITYNNTDLIDKSTITKALDANGLNDINDLMDTSEDGGDMAKVEVYYNKDKNLLVERLFKNGYKGDEDTTRVVYDLTQGKIPDNGSDTNVYYQPSWLVYTWEKLSK
ncbi:alanyl-tRNA synthetase [Leuconostoc citreum]|uniref:alanyl-tRNA synthetase n=1 Tax=Leuconostoc citreum TaxID=33964 RepID=UPI0021A694EF|nr:alanyl-tRNA synthetase [Leuconostoc citreum]MCT3079782.1 alanyl-tRNA synthetase [Leuconostoc citreum]MCT3081670.1 alanyl-tRNA synthetase [Leuconostoc citreum]MCT3083600.1 alanyl-tRNA synthetase [Leuconostoc citreum]